jgi:hypothetical protein
MLFASGISLNEHCSALITQKSSYFITFPIDKNVLCYSKYSFYPKELEKFLIAIGGFSVKFVSISIKTLQY